MKRHCTLQTTLRSSLAFTQEHKPTMIVGEVFLESVSTGVITAEEIDWITSKQIHFDRQEEAMVLKLGRLLDEGVIQIGCRLLRA
jgi:membrane-anchored glycerophosphoryl diester phosphodiesterase (GDPDase)